LKRKQRPIRNWCLNDNKIIEEMKLSFSLKNGRGNFILWLVYIIIHKLVPSNTNIWQWSKSDFYFISCVMTESYFPNFTQFPGFDLINLNRYQKYYLKLFSGLISSFPGPLWPELCDFHNYLHTPFENEHILKALHLIYLWDCKFEGLGLDFLMLYYWLELCTLRLAY